MTIGAKEPIMKLSVYVEVKDRGWEAVAFDLMGAPADLSPAQVSLTAFLGERQVPRYVRSLEPIAGGFHLVTDPIYYNGDFRM